MSNFLLRDPDCVLIHIPKTGGTSIRKGVWNKNYDGPVFGTIPPTWDHHFKFAFVRHPFDRLLSAWRMFTQGPKGDDDWRLPPDARPLSIDEFVAIATDDNILFDERRATFEERIRHHTIPQTHPFNCLELANFVGRFERLEDDFAIIKKRLGLTQDLPHLHRTEPAPWQNHLTPPLREICAAYYEEDFKRLSYSA